MESPTSPPTLEQMRVSVPRNGTEDDLRPEQHDELALRPLPESAWLELSQSNGAAPWLDRYIAFSRTWSPRAHDGFHEAVGLWLLSTVAAHRVRLDLGGPRYTNLYIALAARTSLYAKSTTTRIALDMLAAAGLTHLLAPDDATPQAFIRTLALRLPDNYTQLSPRTQEQVQTRLAFAAQRGWYFDEFGQKVAGMMREGGFMADFRSLLRRLDDCPTHYEYATVGRGSDVIEAPYLALICNMTPADLVPFAGRGAALWNDGFWARFGFVTPPNGAERPQGRFPDGERVVPEDLVRPLRAWHHRLGVPEVVITEHVDDNGKGSGRYDVLRRSPDEERCTLADGVFEAFYHFHDGLLDTLAAGDLYDLDGNYARFAEKALRVAMLLASLENGGHIEMRHWARGQQVAERWRQGLHHLYAQVTGGGELSAQRQLEEKILLLIADRGPLTAREIYTYTNTRSATIKEILPDLVADGKLEPNREGRTLRYRLVG